MIEKVKLTSLPESADFEGLHTIGVDKDGRSVKVPLTEVGRAIEGAGHVNAVLKGDTLQVTDRDGVTSSANVRGPKGDKGDTGPSGPAGVSEGQSRAAAEMLMQDIASCDHYGWIPEHQPAQYDCKAHTDVYQDFLTYMPDLKKKDVSDSYLDFYYSDYTRAFCRFRNLAVFDTDLSWATNLESAFDGCEKLLYVNLNTPKCTRFFYALNNCVSLLMAKVMANAGTTFEAMFSGCVNLRRVTFTGMYLDAKNLYGMFYGCDSLERVEGIDCRSVTEMGAMFDGCYSLKELHMTYFGAQGPEAAGSGSLDLWLGDSPYLTRDSVYECFFTNAATNRIYNGWPSLNLSLHMDVCARLSDGDVAAIASRGITVYRV